MKKRNGREASNRCGSKGSKVAPRTARARKKTGKVRGSFKTRLAGEMGGGTQRCLLHQKKAIAIGVQSVNPGTEKGGLHLSLFRAWTKTRGGVGGNALGRGGVPTWQEHQSKGRGAERQKAFRKGNRRKKRLGWGEDQGIRAKVSLKTKKTTTNWILASPVKISPGGQKEDAGS